MEMQNCCRIGLSIPLAHCKRQFIKRQSYPRRRAAADGLRIAVINRREPGGVSPARRGGGDVAPLYKDVRKRNRLMWTD